MSFVVATLKLEVEYPVEMLKLTPTVGIFFQIKPCKKIYNWRKLFLKNKCFFDDAINKTITNVNCHILFLFQVNTSFCNIEYVSKGFSFGKKSPIQDSSMLF